LIKAINFVQEHVLDEGSQKNESFVEKLKDKEIAHLIRHEYKNATGHEFFIKKN